ncbi:MAG: phosphoribosylglycinamide formyltransferase [Planctomycetota bacterium]|nr:MAG: phosphoribosylglycinamide formyltransferase [Planctomycetota bacterium]
MTLRLAVLLSGGGRTLVNLAQAMAQGQLDAEICLVLSSRRSAGGVQRAADLGLPVEVLRPRDFAQRADFDQRQAEMIAAAKAQLVIMAGYLVHMPVPAGWEGRMLNIHPSLLPAYGGQGMYGEHVHAAVLAASEGVSGCSVHVVDDRYDQGPLLAQARVPVRGDDDVSSLAARVFEAECRTYPQAIAAYADRLAQRGELLSLPAPAAPAT